MVAKTLQLHKIYGIELFLLSQCSLVMLSYSRTAEEYKKKLNAKRSKEELRRMNQLISTNRHNIFLIFFFLSFFLLKKN